MLKSYHGEKIKIFFVFVLGLFLSTASLVKPLYATGEDITDDLDIFSQHTTANVLFVIDTSCYMSAYCGNCGNIQDGTGGDFSPVTPAKKTFPPDWRINIARQITEKIMNNTFGTRFGVMRIKAISGDGPDKQGGHLVAELGTSVTQIKTLMDADGNLQLINGKTCNTNFKETTGMLARTLVDAGYYFTGKKVLGDDKTYTNPITSWCQKNYIIYITAGIPRGDDSTTLYSNDYIISGKKIKDATFGSVFDLRLDASGKSKYKYCVGGPNNYLPNVASYLKNVDLRPDLSGGNATKKVSITTFVIGLDDDKPGAPTRSYQLFLNETASRGGSGTAYYNSGDQLNVDLNNIINTINTDTSSFAAPTVPASKTNNMYSSNYVYIPYFKPQPSGLYLGNLKKFGIDTSGNLLSKDGKSIYDKNSNKMSYWSSSSDFSVGTDSNVSIDITKGGVVGNMTWGGRSFYTNNGSKFVQLDSKKMKTDSGYKKEDFGPKATSDQEALDIIKYIKGETTTKRAMLGDIVHSRPSVLQEDNRDILFIGSNDGFLHCFADNGDSVSEEWSFIPKSSLSTYWNIVPTYKLLNNSHYYFADGESTIFPKSSTTLPVDLYLCYGMRRGGTEYHLLKVGQREADGENTFSDIDGLEYTCLSDSALKNEPLGKSWCKPQFCRIMNGSSTIDALIISGGYDWTKQDYVSSTSDCPSGFTGAIAGGFSDDKGKAIYVIDTSDFKLEKTWTGTSDTVNKSWTGFNAGIPDFVAFDSNGDGITDTIYAGDNRGSIYGITDRFDKGNWNKEATLLLKQAYGKYGQDAEKKNWYYKIFYAPDVLLCKDSTGDFDYIFWGTGDKEHPDTKVTQNKFYGLKVRWNSSNTVDTSPIVNDGLSTNMLDVTTYTINDEEFLAKKQKLLKGETYTGWCFSFDGKGEKIMSSPITYKGIVYFTTYVPSEATVDVCTTKAIGETKLYAVRYDTGEAAYARLEDEKKQKSGYFWDTKRAGNENTDRFIHRGSGMPTELKLVGTPKSMSLVWSQGDDTFSFAIDENLEKNTTKTYWKQNK